MKKELLKAKMLLVALMMASATMFVACENDDTGDDDGGKTPGNEQTGEPLAAVDAATISFERGNGQETATLTMKWGEVANAEAYQIDVLLKTLVTNTGLETPNELKSHKTTERETLALEYVFDVQYGGTYEISIAAVGDGKTYANSEAVTVEYEWYVAPATAAAGELSTILPALLAENVNEAGEASLGLVVGRTYTLNAPVDFGAYNVTVQSFANVGTDEEPVYVATDEHALVVLGKEGTFRTGNSLTLKNLSIDATEHNKPEYNKDWTSAGWGLVEGSADATALAAGSYQYLGKDEEGNKLGIDNYLLNNIAIDGCYIKNLHGNVTFFGEYAWSYLAVSVTNSIIQLDNDGNDYSDATVFGGYGGGFGPSGDANWRAGAVKDLLVENSTIYNIKENSKNRMIRWNGNAINHHFATTTATEVSITFNNATISKVMTAKEFANGTWNKPEATITFTNTVYRDCFRVFNKMNIRSCTYKVGNNLGYYSGFDGGDAAGSQGDDEATLAEIQGVNWTPFTFAGESYVDTALDFTAENGYGAINFKASAATAGQGDPRWE